MKRLAALALAAGLACVFTVDVARAAEPTPQALLTDALLCKVDPLATIRKMAADAPAGSDKGYTAHLVGEGMDELGVVILPSPLEIAGAKTSAVGLTFVQSEDFGALVYGRFDGDYQQVVKALKLAPTAMKDGLRLGEFTRPMAVGVDGRPDKVCPMTIALHPQADGSFLLGCGWCNG